MSDFRLAIREFVRSRVTSIVALFSLAIGIGANTAIQPRQRFPPEAAAGPKSS